MTDNRPELDRLMEDLVEKNCNQCQGMSMPGTPPGEPGYCSNCKGEAYVKIGRYFAMTDHERMLVLEREVMRLRPDFAEKWGRKS